jgi:hypothetical protein
LHVVLGHPLFVERPVGDLLAVGRPGKGLGKRKFFFVHPVGAAVDEFVGLAGGGQRLFGAAGQVHQEQVVVAGKGHLAAVGRKRGVRLLAAGRQAGEFFGLEVVDEIVALGGTAVNAFDLAADEHLRLVGAEQVFVKRLQAGVVGLEQVVDAQQRLHGLAGGHVVFHHGGAAVALGEGGIVPARRASS